MRISDIFETKTISTYSTHLSTIVGILALALTISFAPGPDKESISEIIKIVTATLIAGIVVLLVIAKIIRWRKSEKLKVATYFEKLVSDHPILTNEEIANIDINNLPVDKLFFLNRIQTEEKHGLYWLSSWLGAGGPEINSDKSKCSKVENIIVKDNYFDEIYGRIPIVETSFDGGKIIKAFKFKFQHIENGFWCAVIHGKKGKPNINAWEESTIDISSSQYLQFYAKTVETYNTPDNVPQEGAVDSPKIKKEINIYVRIEDNNRISTDGVIIKVPSRWKKFKIPISKFLIDYDLVEDYHEYVKEYIFNSKRVFDEKTMMQVMFGCSSKMPSEDGTILIYDLKFV